MSSTTASDSPSSLPVPTVFITAATGTQGLNLATLLRSPPYNWHIRTTVRDPTSPSSLRLASLGVHLTPGSWDDIPALTTALSTCTHLFLNTVPSFTDPLLERQQTSRILSLAKAAGVKHVVFSSAIIVNRLDDPELGFFTRLFPDAKDSIMGHSLLNKAFTEKTLKGAGFKYWTILRGASFMENYLAPKVYYYGEEFVTKRKSKMVYHAQEDKIPLVDTLDIAKFATLAFKEPERFNGQEITIAGEALSMGEIVDKLSEVVGGKRFEYLQMGEKEIEEARKGGNPFVLGQLAMKALGGEVSVEEAKSWGVEVGGFAEFLEREGELVRKTYQ